MKSYPYNRPIQPRLVADACAGIWSAASFYEYPILGRPERDAPGQVCLSVWSERSKWLDANRQSHLHAERQAVSKCIAHQMQSWDAPNDIVQSSIDKLSKEDALVVIGGQQVNLLAGPMLIIYKAITIIRMAKQAEKALNRPVVPVFWLASEDHDWDEVNQLVLQNASHQPVKIQSELKAEGKTVRDMDVEQAVWQNIRAAINEALPETEFTNEVLLWIEQKLQRSKNMVDACASVLIEWFAADGLLLIDAHDPHVRELQKPLFQRIIDQNDVLRDEFNSREMTLRKQGYQSGVLWESNCTHLFMISEGKRKLLYADGPDGVKDKKGESRWTWEALQRTVDENPELFSTNVLTRTIMQEYMFPVLSAVLGTSEIAYWSATGKAFERFGMQQPPLLTRRAYYVYEGPVEAALEKLKLSVEQVLSDGDRLRQMWVEGHSDDVISEAMEEWEHAMLIAYVTMQRKVERRLPEMKQILETNQHKINEQVNYLLRKIESLQQQQMSAGLRQWDRVLFSLTPQGKPQERVYHPIVYMNKYGISRFHQWTRELIEEAAE